jgi:AraC-like DNA-binding protein
MSDLFDEFGSGELLQLPFHKNPGLEIVYLHHGRLVWQCEGRQETVHPGSLYFTLPWQEHGSTGEFESGHQWSFVVMRLPGAKITGPTPFGFPAELGFDQPTSKAITALLLNAPRHAWPSTGLFQTLITTLVAELSSPRAFHCPRVVHLTAQLILELATILGNPKHQGDSTDTDRFPWLIKELERRCAEPWTLNAMATLIGLKHTRFSELFHHYTGDSPLRYLNRIRVEKARHMLRNEQRSITDIALDCGFSSSQHFARVFREFSGVTAQAYRQNKLAPLILPRQSAPRA